MSADAAAPARRALPAWLQRLPRIYLALVGMVLLLGLISPLSVEPGDLLNLMRQGATIGLVAIGQTFVLISGGLDLSVGSIVILADVMAAQMINGQPQQVLPVTLLVLAVGAGFGAVNGTLVTRFNVAPFIATLGTNLIVFGIALVYSGGAPRGSIPPEMRFWGNGFIGGVFPAAALVWLIFAVLAWLLLTRTTFGRALVAVGANRRAAHLSGIHDARVTFLAYVASGFMAAAAGLLLVAFIGVGTLEVGTDFLLGSIAAVVIGGTPFEGGRGTMAGSFGGVLFLMVLYSILTVLALPTSGRRIVEGVIILAAITLYSRQRE
ncbi:MAG: ABC transporter permease [Anaerolineae bacterium]|jgi:ribose transport system permease protein|nr:ABC transporter permease [Anaerolineae bacterium]